MRKFMPVFFLAGVIGGVSFFPSVCKAEIAGGQAFENAPWEMVYEEELQRPGGMVQSICATEHYIITIENTTDETDEPDVVSAYYKNTVDENGNPVEQFSLAKRVEDTDWEHGNGMAYNPNTGEIYVAPYTNRTPEAKGSIFVMDPDTLSYKRSIKISDDFNILGIGYKEDTQQYVIQTDIQGEYSFKILDADFQMVEDLGSFRDREFGDNFQDLYVSGDYIINYPLTYKLGVGDYINMYSISEKKKLSSVRQEYNFQDVKDDEPEGICELEPGKYITVVNVALTDESRKFRFYAADIPYYVTVTASAENGSVDESSQRVLKGTTASLSMKAEKGYELSEVELDGQEQKKDTANDDTMKETLTYEIPNIQKNSQLHFIFTKIPFNYKPFILGGIVTAAIGGFSMLLAMVHIKRERERKRARARIARRRIIWEQESQMVDWETEL